jgi:hypothetical protein
MSLLMTVYLAALFVALTPGVLVRLPNGGSKLTVALTHAVVFVVVVYFTKGLVAHYTENFAGSGSAKPKAAAKPAAKAAPKAAAKAAAKAKPMPKPMRK